MLGLKLNHVSKRGHCYILLVFTEVALYVYIFILNGIIDKCKAKGRPLYTCFVDFKSVFDLITRSALLFKLMNTGCTGKVEY